MLLENNVMYELIVFGGAGAAGVILAFLYDLFRLKRRMVRTKRLLIHIEDILYWLCSAIIVFLFSYVLSSGETRLYFFGGIFTGGLLYFTLFSRSVLWLLSVIIETLIWPFREIFKFLRPILCILYIRFSKMTGKVKNIASVERHRTRVSFNRFRNTFSKK